MIKNIIFDLGGVILTIDHHQSLLRFKELGLKDAETWLDPYTQKGFFGDLEAGKITAEEFREMFSELIGHEVSLGECAHAWQGYLKDLPKRNLEELTKLRREGYKVILMSNTNPFMMSWAESDDFDGMGNPLSSYFDACYKSYQVKMMKPDLNFFRYVIDKEGISPCETLFVDDSAKNVEAAGKLGINIFQPVNGEDWTNEIHNHLNEDF